MFEMASPSEELRKRCKYLKWEKDISYWEMAKAIEMDKNSFYNFISGSKVRISSNKQIKLKEFLDSKETI